MKPIASGEAPECAHWRTSHGRAARVPARRPGSRRGQKVPGGFGTVSAAAFDGITWRVRKTLAAAGFKDPDKDKPDADANTEDDQEGAQEKSPVVRGEIHAERNGGLRRASIRDFHSFRVTWVTVALTAGVPMELVTKVTGHKTVEIVLKHYFQPGREEFRRALQSAMPKLLTNGSKTPKDQMLEVLDGITAKTWKAAILRLRVLVTAL